MKPVKPTIDDPELFPSLLRGRRIATLWITRMLVRQGAFSSMYSGSRWDLGAVLDELGLPNLDSNDEAAARNMVRRLRVTWKQMEKCRSRYRMPPDLEWNLKLLSRQFSLTATERKILALAVILRADDICLDVARATAAQINLVAQIATVVGSPSAAVSKALAPGSTLRRSGLINVSAGSSVDANVSLRRASLRRLAFGRLASIEDLFGEFLRSGQPASLTLDDFSHVSPRAGDLLKVVSEALGSRRRGVNILLYGRPGTGKTELTRTLAAEAAARLFDVSSMDADGKPVSPKARLAGVSTAQLLLANQRALLVFDETDAVFDGRPDAEEHGAADAAKAWVNQMLESNPVPTVWIANRISTMDPAFVRRFDAIVEMKTPPLRQRLRQLEHECGSYLSTSQMRRLAAVETLTPAVVARAASVVRRIDNKPQVETLEGLLDGTLRAQGHAPLKRSYPRLPPDGYDIGWCNASEDLEALVQGLMGTGSARICLYGPPGTGKTAFGSWLAGELDKPLSIRRMSDLQSPLLGVMERNLAAAFEQASRDDAVLQIDEVDSFLRDRRDAERSWEVSQVNEFLTQLESFDGVFIASTNLMDRLDAAALRRFDYKIRLDYLQPEQVWKMFTGCMTRLGIQIGDVEGSRRSLARLNRVTPGDFALLERRHRTNPFLRSSSVIDVLRTEVAHKEGTSRRIGFT